MRKVDEPSLKARLILSTSNAPTCNPQTGHGISMYLGGPTTPMMQNSDHLQAEIHDTITLLHHAEDTCYLPYESQLSFLNIRESVLGPCHSACLLISWTDQTSISGSDASLRHAPRASPQAKSSPRSHISSQIIVLNANLR